MLKAADLIEGPCLIVIAFRYFRDRTKCIVIKLTVSIHVYILKGLQRKFVYTII